MKRKEDSKKRLFEVFGHVDPKFKLAYEIRLINESISYLSEEEFDEPEEEHEISAKDIETSNKLDKEAETATPQESDIDKPLIDREQKKGINLTVKVPTYKKKLLEKNINSLKKLAKRLSVPEPKITIGEVHSIKVKNPHSEIPPYEYYEIDVQEVTIEAEGMFQLSGDYTLVAVVDNRTSGSIEIDEKHPVPEEYLRPSGKCDLCNQERYRGKNFIVLDGSNNSYLVLGSSCVKKYIGINPAKYIKTLDYWKDFQITMEGLYDEEEMFPSGGGGGGISAANRLVDKNKVFSIVYDIIKRDGYEKREWDEEESRWGQSRRYRTNSGDATADKVEEIIYEPENFNNYPLNKEGIAEFTKFATGLEPLPPKMVDDPYGDGQVDKNAGFNEYRAKVKDFATRSNLRIRETALLASAFNYMNNEKIRQAKANQLQGSEWVGSVGQKAPFPHLKLDGYRTGEGAYGVWELWSFVDDNGNSLKKFGNLPDRFKIANAPEGSENMGGHSKGDIFAFTSDVKKHDEYNGIKTTQLGRLSKL
jgi:hypothetical protein